MRGEIVIDRIAGVALTEDQWLSSEQLLLPMEMADMHVGFETAPELAHADFANMFIGGGVLSGGCVQEEIRFAICPELCVSMLVCPCMQPEEAIQIIGGEQFSDYSGYAFGLQYNGDHTDKADRAPDGSVRVAVLAMDAIDFRGLDSSLAVQASPEFLLRDLNKSLAAFTPVDDESLAHYPMIATGNWGCGAFQGCAQLKALVQWASASQCGRKLRYFPFDEDFGTELFDFTESANSSGVTVGALLRSLWKFGEEQAVASPSRDHAEKKAIFQQVFDILANESENTAPPPVRINISPEMFNKLKSGVPVTEEEINADAIAMGAAVEAAAPATSHRGAKKVKSKSGKKKGCC
jgi:hypothetical protein